MEEYRLRPIGTIINNELDGAIVQLDAEYAAGLNGLEDCGYVHIYWWANGCDDEESRKNIVEDRPYKKGPYEMGVFATRSPQRPNPLCSSVCYLRDFDSDTGSLRLAWIDALDGSPLIDIKPYVPSLDRVERPIVPAWCRHWPKSVESSGNFDWSAEFNF